MNKSTESELRAELDNAFTSMEANIKVQFAASGDNEVQSVNAILGAFKSLKPVLEAIIDKLESVGADTTVLLDDRRIGNPAEHARRIADLEHTTSVMNS